MNKLASLLLASCISVGVIPHTTLASEPTSHEQKTKRHQMKPFAHLEKRLLSDKAIRHLELTQTQQDKLKAVFATYKAQLEDLKEAYPSKPRQAFKSIIEADTFDKTQAQLLLEEHSPKKQAFMLTMLEARHAIHHILTDEQRSKIAKRKRKYMANMQHKRDN
ncbi:Spy/CpxP family protein refolding chaperone [Pseudoalteromonas luteoviolacea]|uniref:Spy/CpxP family protein refolding chaperone n=1 Tax=Pseudoalteromonas luteoviolacea TaxID=43657 RepID=UPI001B3A4461|nr:Spy/CpxP family protein refolding chaperone [Pseudoalteromonas luteoviolacea]MBQ4876671.1 Spy/CpxP family protein refolding chaperone [Pseudoalteromonas luteoviolacea]MBQ4905540.1 Spy/CpxP family protein refolding chaperone [Pseudoalteromonas luteoviolacea]